MFFLFVFLLWWQRNPQLETESFYFYHLVWSWTHPLSLQVSLILKHFESYCREFVLENRLSRELPLHFTQFGSISANTTYFRTGFSTTPHSNTRKFKDAKQMVLVVKVIANSSSRKYKFSWNILAKLVCSPALCVRGNALDYKITRLTTTFYLCSD